MCIEVLHLIRIFLYVIDDDESIWSHEGEREDEIVQILTFHSVDIDEIEVVFSERREYFLGIAVDRMDIFYFAIGEVLYSLSMSIGRVFDRSDIAVTIDCLYELES
jgi:hypothetical protein